ncbi:MAG: hypothetical protein ACOX1F_03075 [Erysipelotrichaceae bacterium]|jgi:hypothetical protein
MKKVLIIIISLFLITGLAGCKTEPSESSISKDWKDFEFELDGVLHKSPWSFVDFGDNGWRIMDDVNYDIQPNSRSFEFYMIISDSHYDKGYKYYSNITVEFENRTDEVKKMKECDIRWLSFQNLPAELNSDIDMSHIAYDLKLAKGISWGATEEQVIAAYGNVEEEFRAQRDKFSVLQYYTLTDDNLLSIMNLAFYNDSLYAVNFFRYYVEAGYEHTGVQL